MGIYHFFSTLRHKAFPYKEPNISKNMDIGSLDDDDAKAAPGKLAKNPGFGSEPTIKTLYEGRRSRPGAYDWVDYPPRQMSKSAARAHGRVAIRTYKIKDLEKPCIGGHFPLRYHEIEIQNPLLVALLEPLAKKENVFLDIHESATFTYPFRVLWFCHDDIMNTHKKMDVSDATKPHLTLLVRLMEDLFSNLRVRWIHFKANGLIDFKHAWTLFPRGSTVYSYGLNSEFLGKVETTNYSTCNNVRYIFIKIKIMTFNGDKFVWEDKTLAIRQFVGYKPVRELEHYPLEFHPEGDTIKSRCISRGKKMLDFQGLNYCCYEGLAIQKSGEGISKHNIEGRVLIDPVGYNKYHLNKGNREDSDPSTDRNQAGKMDRHRASRRRRQPPIEQPDEEGEAVPVDRQHRLSDEEQLTNKKDMLSREDELGFMSELVGGYALKSKVWVEFYVEDIRPMVWNDEAYSHLVYDDQQKDLVLSFVENHKPNPHTGPKPNSAAAEDVIIGKGQGLIMLLSGPPGTGKTLTAEAISDRTHRPLFYLQAEDLGINAAALGANIKRVFEMATDWDAVVLLDEADVFMAERNPNDIHRNELVSIFLRELEYYKGILFLTTNLYQTIDVAFRSRVNLHLLFQELSRDKRETVWRNFLNRMPEVSMAKTNGVNGSVDHQERPLDDEDVKELSLWQLNGREIKNAVKMARRWCDHKGYMLTLERLENGIRATNPHSSKDTDVDGSLYD